MLRAERLLETMVSGEPFIIKDLSLPVSPRDPARNLSKLAKFRGFSASLGRLRFRGGGLNFLSEATWRLFLRSRFWVSPLFNTLDSGRRIGREPNSTGGRWSKAVQRR